MAGNAWAGPLWVIALVVLGLAAMPEAAAHGDRDVADGRYRLPAGETVSFDTELHYHRIAARVDADDAMLTLVLRDPAGHERVLAGPGDTLRVNTLVPCCEDRVWADHTISLRNAGHAEAVADVRIALLHDGLAVAADDAETGAAASMVVIPGVLAVALGTRLLQGAGAPTASQRRRALGAYGATAVAALLLGGVGLFLFAAIILGTIGRGPRDVTHESPRPWLRRALILLATGWVAALVLAVWGMMRYGGGPATGTLVATADLPIIEGDILSVHLLVSVTFIALAATTQGMWTAAVRRGAPRGQALPVAFAMSVGALVLSVSWALEYGRLTVPLGAGLAWLVLPLGGVLWTARTAPRLESGDAHPVP